MHCPKYINNCTFGISQLLHGKASRRKCTSGPWLTWHGTRTGHGRADVRKPYQALEQYLHFFPRHVALLPD